MKKTREKNILKKYQTIVLLLIAILPSFYFYLKYQKINTILQNPQLIVQEEAKKLATKVGKLILLPEGEIPKVVTVFDPDKLKDQTFFAKAKIGDKVLFFNNKTILYDPQANKIVEVGFLTISSFQPSFVAPAPTSGPEVAGVRSPSLDVSLTAKLRVVIYNGTSKIGLTSKVEKLIKEEAPELNIVDRDSAARRDYPKTLLIDLKSQPRSNLEKLANILTAEINILPEGEIKPEKADLLVIVGADKI